LTCARCGKETDTYALWHIIAAHYDPVCPLCEMVLLNEQDEADAIARIEI
jgi:hypothetical protein